MDLLWTTLSEFPGEGPLRGGAGAWKPENVAAVQRVAPPDAAWKQIPFLEELGVIFSILSYKLSRTVKGLIFDRLEG